jgi:hypothetical protein
MRHFANVAKNQNSIQQHFGQRLAKMAGFQLSQNMVQPYLSPWHRLQRLLYVLEPFSSHSKLAIL